MQKPARNRHQAWDCTILKKAIDNSGGDYILQLDNECKRFHS